eukprot:TRINITY_DN3591_c0_g2_i2.p1 TRINITY_DN3591_c0_g2~~TRINITY_DN3591_c0_g2_i2.p1  ORF type:complete len:444 (-),score=88.00 TRINITY_DN3591_c0_g2_i2:184-1515(-)
MVIRNLRAAAGSLRCSCGARRNAGAVAARGRSRYKCFSSSSGANSQVTDVTLEDDCSWKAIGDCIAGLGGKCLVVHGGSNRAQASAQRILFEIRKARVDCTTYTVKDLYPTAPGIDEGLSMAKRIGAMSVVGLGRGGVVDTAKAIAALVGTKGKCQHFLESPSDGVLGSSGTSQSKAAYSAAAIPCVAVPSGIGVSAATSPSVHVLHPEDGLLVPMKRHHSLLPRVALVDPLLTATLRETTALSMAVAALAACVDALLVAARAADQDAELSRRQALALEGIRAIARGLPAAAAAATALSDSAQRLALVRASIAAGAAVGATAAPPMQTIAMAAGSLLPLTPYSELVASLFPHFLSELTEAEDEAADTVLKQVAAVLGSETVAGWVRERTGQFQPLLLGDMDATLPVAETAGGAELLFDHLQGDGDEAPWSDAAFAARIYDAAL